MELADKLNDSGCLDMYDVYFYLKLFLEEPEYVIPQKAARFGRPAKGVKPDQPLLRIDEYCKTLEKEEWTKINVAKQRKVN